MKLVFAVDKISYNDKDHVGVVKKVQAQLRLFQKNGITTTLCQYEWKNGRPNIEVKEDTDILYFRRVVPSVNLIRTLHHLKEISPKLRIIMEIPTYPFSAEERERIKIKTKINTWIGERLLKTCVDRIALVAQPTIKELYGIPVLNINNGVDFDNIKVKEQINLGYGKNEINLICVSGCFFWHGYDRIIEGLHYYYSNSINKEEVYLHIVGEGASLEEYKRMARCYGLLDKKIFFYGTKVGTALDEIYNKCDIALECLGGHRKNFVLSSSLKSREYAAKGLPMIAANDIDIYNEKTGKYIKIFPANDMPIDIKEVVKFYHEIYDGKEKLELASVIRQEFYQYCDWKFVCKSVLEYISEGK